MSTLIRADKHKVCAELKLQILASPLRIIISFIFLQIRQKTNHIIAIQYC